jgi:Zn finger protein HypA/HybF involved in hydrogenase expression
MPIPTKYTCTNCYLTGSTFSSWGAFNYKVNKKLIPLKRTTGICHNCNSIGPVEVLSNNQGVVSLKERKSPPRCLNCGSHHFDVIPNFEPDPERLRSGTPVRTGLMHKNCGGHIYADYSGPNLFMGDNLPERIFDIEGIEINE